MLILLGNYIKIRLNKELRNMPNEKLSAFDTFEDTFVSVELDKKTRSLVVVSHDEHMLHEGKMYHYYGSKDTASSGTFIFQLTTPDVGTQEAHLRFLVKSEESANIKFYENPNASTGGTSVTLHNANRILAYPAESGAKIDPSPTIGSAVVLMDIDIGAKGTEGALDDSGEWLLKGNTRYLIYVTNTAATSGLISIEIDLHELSPWN